MTPPTDAELEEIRKRSDWLDVRRLLDEVQRLRAIAEKLPKTLDGVVVTPGMILYWQSASPTTIDGIKVDSVWSEDLAEFYDGDESVWIPLDAAYSTRAAALAAQGAQPPRT